MHYGKKCSVRLAVGHQYFPFIDRKSKKQLKDHCINMYIGGKWPTILHDVMH